MADVVKVSGTIRAVRAYLCHLYLYCRLVLLEALVLMILTSFRIGRRLKWTQHMGRCELVVSCLLNDQCCRPAGLSTCQIQISDLARDPQH